jgi:drug/metabolite transporter superfamily protein YnfA
MEKGAVVPLLLLALTVAYFVPRLRDVRRYWRAWAIYGGVLACYAVVFLIQLHTSAVQPGNPGSAGHVFGLIKTMVLTSLLPGALGGPWRWATGSGYDQAAPPVVLQVASWAVALIIVVATCIWRRRAGRAWAILAGWIVAADFVPVIAGRLGGYPASLLGAQTRYLTDATGVLALCAGLALLPLAGEQDAYRSGLGRFGPGALRRPLAVASTALICLVAAGSVWSLERLQSVSNATTATARSYIATAQAAAEDAPPGTVIVDSAVPAVIMDVGLFWNHALTSDVIGARTVPSQHLTWRRTLHGVTDEPMIFDQQGRLWPVTVVGQFGWAGPRVKTGRFAGQYCWLVTAAGTRVPLLGSLYRYAWTIRVTYTGSASVLTAGFAQGTRTGTVTLAAGTHTAYLTAVGGGKAVTLRGAGGGLCVTGVTIGSLRPDETKQAIPPLPVPS